MVNFKEHAKAGRVYRQPIICGDRLVGYRHATTGARLLLERGIHVPQGCLPREKQTVVVESV